MNTKTFVHVTNCLSLSWLVCSVFLLRTDVGDGDFTLMPDLHLYPDIPLRASRLR
jgi:hypothetical protein